jgi:RimJ/RimL family protein N-acetyltransferase
MTLEPCTQPVRLETQRLILDGHCARDFDAFAAMWADPEVVGPIGGEPSTPAQSWSRLLCYRGLWPVLGYGYWAVREKAGGYFIGDLGFADFRRAIEPPILTLPEAGWAFAGGAQGRGLAGEALAAALSWFDRQAAFAGSMCLIGPSNIRSIRLAERHGFAEPRTVEATGAARLLFNRRRPAW